MRKKVLLTTSPSRSSKCILPLSSSAVSSTVLNLVFYGTWDDTGHFWSVALCHFFCWISSSRSLYFSAAYSLFFCFLFSSQILNRLKQARKNTNYVFLEKHNRKNPLNIVFSGLSHCSKKGDCANQSYVTPPWNLPHVSGELKPNNSLTAGLQNSMCCSVLMVLRFQRYSNKENQD